MTKIKSLSAKLRLAGTGLVNYNGNEPSYNQKKRFEKHITHNGEVSKNCSFAKEHVKIVDEKKVVKKFIDSNLIRKESLGCENELIANVVSNNSTLKLKFLSQLNMVARGWMYTLEKSKNKPEEVSEDGAKKPKAKKDDSSAEKAAPSVVLPAKEKGIIIKRKSGVSVGDAIQTCGAITSMIVGTKESATEDGVKNSNSLFYRESCGEIHYESEIDFDVKQLQFISLDDNYDRMAFFEREAKEYMSNLEKKGYKCKKGKFATTHDNLVGEQGIVLPDQAVYDMIRAAIDKILNINIRRAGAYAKTEQLVLLLNGTEVEIKTIEDFDKLGLEFGLDFIEIE